VNRFSFTVQVSGLDPAQDDYEERLFRAGCGDGLVAVIDGKLFVDFDREAASFDTAVASASGDIERAGGHVVHALPTTNP
jgi:hypothetical protein